MSEQIMRENLFVIAQTFATAKGLALTTVSKRFHGNQNFLNDYVKGDISTTLKTYFGIIDKLREEWPTGTKWPETRSIPRPTRVAYRAPTDLPPRGDSGKFLGKKVHKQVARA